jgi:hydrophobe/amphiphile efflux-3 (HAE3) family protein
MKRLAQLLTGHPVAIIALLLIATVAALHGIVDLRTGERRLEIDPAIDRLLPEDDQERRFYDRARKIFGEDEFVLLVIESNDVFQTDVLERLQRITERLEAEDSVARVVSLTNAVHSEDREGELYVGPYFEEVPRDTASLAQLREQVLEHPIYGGTLVSRDARSTSIIVFCDEDLTDRQFVDQDFGQHLGEIAREAGGGLPLVVTGTQHVKAKLSRKIVEELRLILPMVLSITALLCLIAFRSVRGLVLPLVAIGMALVWTLGLMGWTGTPISLVSNIVPPLIITLGFAAAMHVVAEYYDEFSHLETHDRAANRLAIQKLIEHSGLVVLVNGFTTILGFASLCVSSVLAIREFGIWSVIGVTAATVTSLLLIPSALVLAGPPRRLPKRPGAHGRFEAVADWLSGFAVRRRSGILAAAGVLLVISLFGMSRIHVSTGFVSNFMPRAEVRSTFERINERLEGVSSIAIVVESKDKDAFAEPENLRALGALQDWLEQQPEIGGTASLADSVMLLHQAFRPEAGLEIPERTQLVKQLLLFGGTDVTDGFVDASYQIANVTVRTKVSESGQVRALLERIHERLGELPAGLQARPTGDLVLLTRTMDDIARGQLESITTAIVTIYLTLSLMLWSLRVGLYALLPNLIPIAAYYGVLGLTNTPLNLSTSLIGSITLGIAVDDTVHYFARFAREARQLGDERKATAATLSALIRPVVFTSLGLIAGFLVLTTSELRNQVQFGMLSAFTITVALLLELTLSPAICSGVRIVTLWDLLSLDLGKHPQRAIPLFKDMSQRQARVVALLSRMVEIPAGTRLLQEGDKGQDMYVVIDGELVASLQREGRRVELSRMERGATVGEVALFGKTRSADVDVVQPARLLKLGNADLERVARRYPRVAAKLYRNLNQIVVERLFNTRDALR